ncbi:hypothetical protein PSAB6_640024 [Paraburkholderia sabiae]|nr:hypothetical protein PSAB6_640024 [Paraburkholderia sabiae]
MRVTNSHYEASVDRFLIEWIGVVQIPISRDRSNLQILCLQGATYGNRGNGFRSHVTLLRRVSLEGGTLRTLGFTDRCVKRSSRQAVASVKYLTARISFRAALRRSSMRTGEDPQWSPPAG